MKQCKQCGRMLEDECFRKTKSRSKGIYKGTTQGSRTICRSCESLNVRVHKALKDGDEESIVELRKHYERLRGAGYPPVTAAAKRLLGVSSHAEAATTRGTRRINDALLVSQQMRDDVLEHADKVRGRLYGSVEEADAVHRTLEDQLREAGLYEEITNLLDDWYME